MYSEEILIDKTSCILDCDRYTSINSRHPTQVRMNSHYENKPMIYTDFSYVVKTETFQWKCFDIFLIFAQNRDRRYTLALPRRGSSNEYPQSMFWSKNRYTPANPSFALQKLGTRG